MRSRWLSFACWVTQWRIEGSVVVATLESGAKWGLLVNPKSKVSYAIAAILSGSCATFNHARAATADNSPGSEGIAEVMVTAQRRNESVQDVPITIQAITGDTLKQLNVVNFDDLLRYTPNVTYSGNGPGTGNIFLRGLSTGNSGNQSQSTTAPFPNVAVYLDDQSMQFPQHNNDVYLVDMERVEVLEGPQGTLFGGGSQAGAIRYITNKPKINVTEGDVNASYGITAGGDPNASANATINIPVIADKLAVRATIFDDHRGGYISNVPGTIGFTNVPSAAALKQYPGTPSTQSPVVNNAGLTGSNLNSTNTTGFRLSGFYEINDNWDLLIQQNYQNFEADGYFSAEPVAPDGQVLAPYQTSSFSPSYYKDRYESTAWTLNGQVTDLLKMVYTGSYMVRHIEQQQDYSNYLTSATGSYYDCSGRGAGSAYFRTAKPTTCNAPVASWNDTVRNTHQSHEIRLATSEEKRIRAVVGVYWEKFVIDDLMNYDYMAIPQCNAANLAISAAGGQDCVAAVGPIPGYYAADPGTRLNSNTSFGMDAQRGYKQLAEFGSIDFDILPKVLTLTAGTRHYHYDEFETGSEFYSASPGTLNAPNGSITNAGFGMNLRKSESGFKSRANLTWHITPDMLAYYTWSQGFRPGGFNRTSTSPDGSVVKLSSVAPLTVGGPKQFYKPVGFNSDQLVNNEIGFKSEFWKHRIQVNISAYQMDWSGVQLTVFDPLHLGNTGFNDNGPSYRVRGAELQLTVRVTDGLTVQGSGSWNSTSQTNAPCLPSNVPASKGNPTPQGACITQVSGQPFTNPYGVLGTSPAFSPAGQFNLRARYDWSLSDYRYFASVGANHIDSMRNEPASFPDGNLPVSQGGCLINGRPNTTLCNYTTPGYTTYDAALGVSKDSWTVQLTGANLANSYAVTNITSGQFIKSEIPIRPRVLSLEVGYKF
jgi:iron complex outermembrane recepter protein